jgi:DNA-binding transcriptional ArsR family regulator
MISKINHGNPSPGPPGVPGSGYELQAQVFKVLSHPARLAILNILRDGERCVCHMEAHLGFRQVYISQQVAVLREAGLVRDRRDGWNIFYRVSDPQIYSILDAVLALTGTAPPETRRENVSCPCPHCNAERPAPGAK